MSSESATPPVSKTSDPDDNESKDSRLQISSQTAKDGSDSSGQDQLQDDSDTESLSFSPVVDISSTQALLLSTKGPPPAQSVRRSRLAASRTITLESLLSSLNAKPIDESDKKQKTERLLKRKLESDGDVLSAPFSHNKSTKSKRSRSSITPYANTVPMSSLGNRRQHSTYWVLDGSVIIEIENVLFRLSRSRLAIASPFFQELFAGGDTGPEIREMKANCLVYKVEDVDVLDFERLLTAMDKGITYALNPPHFFVVASVLRAASVLKFEDLRNWAMGVLEQKWSIQLPSPSITSPFRQHNSWAIEVVQLGLRVDVPQILRHAFYELVRTKNFQQIENNLPDDIADEEKTNPRTGNKLSLKSIYKLVSLRESLRSNWLTVITRPPDIICKKLENDPAVTPCSRNHEGWLKVLTVDTTIQEEGFLDPITALEDMIVNVDWVEEGGFCESCVTTWKGIWTKERQKLWDNLGVWLDLE